jgi:cyclohexa-1,5-dienecarbonyl-CoA hydratase
LARLDLGFNRRVLQGFAENAGEEFEQALIPIWELQQHDCDGQRNRERIAEAMTTFSRIALGVEDRVARLTLRNPPLNVIDVLMMEEMAQAIAQVESHHETAVLVIAGAGKSFSAGADVAAHTPDKMQDMLGKFHAVIRALLKTRKVTIASVQGHCLGGGAELAMVCDFVYTTESAQWGFPEIKLGFYPPVACTGLAALVGVKRAADLILTGRNISGSDAVQIGLATRAFLEEQMQHLVETSIQDLLKLSSTALAITKKAFYAWDAMHFDKGLAKAENICFDELMRTEDSVEGVSAFLEKREPQWKGR